MLNDSCIWTPKADNGKDSKLFEDLQSIFEDREASKLLWGLSKDSSLMEVLGVNKYDNNKEPLAEDLLDKLSSNGGKLKGKSYLKYISLKEKLSDPTKKWSDSYNKMMSLRKRYDDLTFSIVPGSEGYTISASFDTESGRAAERQSIYNNDLYSRLIAFLNTLGFKVSIEDSTGIAETIPVNEADRLADGLKTIIRLSKDRIDALPEEFAHTMITGLRATPLVQRLLNTIKEIGPKNILGDQYDAYRETYKGSDNLDQMLIEEAAGKVLAEALKGNYIIPREPLIKRIWNYIKSIFSKANTEDIDNLIQEAKNYSNELVTEIYSGEVIPFMNYSDIYDHESMKQIESNLDKLKHIAKQALDTLEKGLSLQYLSNMPDNEKKIDKDYISAIEKTYNDKKYLSTIVAFMKYAADDINRINSIVSNFKDSIKNNSKININLIKDALRVARRLNSLQKQYLPVLNTLAYMNEDSELADSLSESDMKVVQSTAKDILDILGSILRYSNQFTFDVLFKFYELYLGDEWIIESAKNLNGTSLMDLLHFATRDTSQISKLFCSASDSEDPFIAINDYVIQKARNYIDTTARKYTDRIKKLYRDYYDETGSDDTSFILHRDKDGNFTGMYKSNIDYDKYYKEKKEYTERRKKANIKPELLYEELKAWERARTDSIKLSNGRIERRPKENLYHSDELKDLNEAQLKFYKGMMEIKEELDFMIPSKYVTTYKAVQKRSTSMGDVLDNVKDPKKAIRILYKTIKDKFIRNENDYEFGNKVVDEIYDNPDIIAYETDEGTDKLIERAILTDFDDLPVYRVPLNYIARLKDMEMLSEDTVNAMISYAAMAANYSGMSQIADAMEIAKDVNDKRRLIVQNRNNRMVEKYSENGRIYVKPYTKPMKNSNSSTTLNSLVNRTVYSIETTKEAQMNKISGYKVFKLLLSTNSLLGLGWNSLSGIGALGAGIAQLTIEGFSGMMSNNTFNLADVIKASAIYLKNVPKTVMDSYTQKTTSIVTALYDYFNMGEDYIGRNTSKDYRHRPLLNILSLFNPMVFLNSGDHYLRSVVMMAYLNHVKVLYEGKETSLLDVIEFNTNTDSKSETTFNFSIPKEVRDINGNPINIYSIKEKIQYLDHGINGAFNSKDKGVAADTLLGKFFMQFRQWMPAYFAKRYGSKRFNPLAGTNVEGFYITAFKFVRDNFKDFVKMKFDVATRYDQLSSEEKTNIWRALGEVSLYIILSVLNNLAEVPSDDDEDPSAMAYLEYMLRRVNLELGASILFNPAFISNAMTIINTPIPAINTADRVFSLFDLTNWFDTIESGKYEGWTKALRDLYYLTPLKNFERSVAFMNGDYTAFNIFNN